MHYFVNPTNTFQTERSGIALKVKSVSLFPIVLTVSQMWHFQQKTGQDLAAICYSQYAWHKRRSIFILTVPVPSYQQAANKNDHQTSFEVNVLVDEPVKSIDYVLRYLLPPQIQICLGTTFIISFHCWILHKWRKMPYSNCILKWLFQFQHPEEIRRVAVPLGTIQQTRLATELQHNSKIKLKNIYKIAMKNADLSVQKCIINQIFSLWNADLRSAC